MHDCCLSPVMVVTRYSRLRLLHVHRQICFLRRQLLLSLLQHRRRPMLLLTLPLRESGRSYFYIFFRAGHSSTYPLQRYKTLVISISGSFRCTCASFLVYSLLYSSVFLVLHSFFLICLSLFSMYSCRDDYESGGG